MLEGGVGMNAGGRGVASEKTGEKELVAGFCGVERKVQIEN